MRFGIRIPATRVPTVNAITTGKRKVGTVEILFHISFPTKMKVHHQSENTRIWMVTIGGMMVNLGEESIWDRILRKLCVNIIYISFSSSS